ncbi:MAG: polyprenyl synthetase family protein [Clostridia bacterium]|nr:polyprenyl synthetase family protein [Deltaproteobacteria bacterium]
MSDFINAQRLVSRDRRRDPVLDPLVAVARTHGVDPLADRLDELKHFVVEDLSAIEYALRGIDAEVRDARDNEGMLARKAARHLLDSPGKRIRPLCVLLAARLGGRSLDPVIRNLAIACELVHAATLLHDDVLDQGEERRGAATARVVFGNSASILGGDHLLVEALKMVESCNEPPLLRSLLGVISEMVHAEAIQLEQRQRFTPQREVYLKVILGKTAALFRWGLTAGGFAAGLPEDTLGHLSGVGEALGMAFQLVDDVIDLEGLIGGTGKTPLADLRDGKLTWPVIVAVEKDAELARDLEDYVRVARADDDVRAMALAKRIGATGALAATRAYAEHQGERAAAELARVPEGAARDAIALVVRDAIRRSR